MDYKYKSNEIGNRWGMMKDEEADLLRSLASKLPSKAVVVNIGAGTGTSALAIREGAPSVSIYTVDFNESGPLGSLEGERNSFSEAKMSPPIEFLGDSSTIGKAWGNHEAKSFLEKGFVLPPGWSEPKIDFLFVDADHLEAGIMADIESWVPHVKKGGILAFHDYEHYFWPDVRKVVDRDIAPKYTFVAKAGTLIVFRK